MKALILALALAAAPITPAVAGSWGYPVLAQGQAQKGQGRAQEPRQRGGRDSGFERQREREDRRGQLSDDERRALHRDLDKANRELYRRR